VRPPVPRFVRWVVSLAVIAALTVVVFQYWATSQYGVATVSERASSRTADSVWTQTQWGPLSPADRDLLVMVRQAGLCGGSTGQQAQQQGTTVGVRTVAQRIWVDYGDLGNQARAVADKLGVALPDQPDAQQQSWMRELSGHSGPDFDRMFAQGLRVTDGAVLPTITSVRAGTRNELIRTFAANAVRLQLHALAYNLGNFLRTLATPEPIKDWSLTSLKEKLIKIGAKVVSHGRYVVFQMAEVAIPRQMFQEILRLIAELRPQPPPAPA